ncbi:hypothetical protein ACMHYB_52505 [Sorangium sp. So ce1128]
MSSAARRSEGAPELRPVDDYEKFTRPLLVVGAAKMSEDFPRRSAAFAEVPLRLAPRTPWKLLHIRWVNPHRGGSCFPGVSNARNALVLEEFGGGLQQPDAHGQGHADQPTPSREKRRMLRS